MGVSTASSASRAAVATKNRAVHRLASVEGQSGPARATGGPLVTETLTGFTRSGLLARPLRGFRLFRRGRCACGRAALLFRKAAIVTFEHGAILGREPLGHRLQDAVPLAARELGPVLAGLRGVHERTDATRAAADRRVGHATGGVVALHPATAGLALL